MRKREGSGLIGGDEIIILSRGFLGHGRDGSGVERETEDRLVRLRPPRGKVEGSPLRFGDGGRIWTLGAAIGEMCIVPL